MKLTLVGIEDATGAPDELVCPREGDTVRWKPFSFRDAWREGIVNKVSSYPKNGYLFKATLSSGELVWGYVSKIIEINGKEVSNDL